MAWEPEYIFIPLLSVPLLVWCLFGAFDSFPIEDFLTVELPECLLIFGYQSFISCIVTLRSLNRLSQRTKHFLQNNKHALAKTAGFIKVPGEAA